MPRYSIASLDDSRLDPYRNLKKTNLTRWSQQFIAEGEKVVERLVESEYAVESVLVREGKSSLADTWDALNIDVLVLPDELASELVGHRFHAGVLACGRRITRSDFDSMIHTAGSGVIVACPRITDPDNLGSLIRIARAFGADGMIVGRESCDPFSRRTIRVSMGNVFFVPIVESAEILDDLNRLRDDFEYSLLATALTEEATKLKEVTPREKCVLLLGNETDGLEQRFIELADEVVTIPMNDDSDSLNVTVAAGIVLYQLTAGRGDV